MLSIQQIPVANTMERRLSIRTQMEENKLIGNPFVRICVTNSYTDNKAMILVLLLLLCFHPFLSLSLPCYLVLSLSSFILFFLALWIHGIVIAFIHEILDVQRKLKHRIEFHSSGKLTKTLYSIDVFNVANGS